MQRYFDWIDRAIGNLAITEQPVQIVYGVAGEWVLTEHTLDHLHGFSGNGPVGVGNNA